MNTVEVPECLLKPLEVPGKLLMGPGPANISPRVLAAGTLPVLGHLHTEFIQIMDEVKQGIQYAFQTKNPVTLAVTGAGHAAMETTACNLVEPGDVILSVCTGIWGDRFAEMVDRQGGHVIKIHKLPGEVFSLTELEQALEKHRPAVMFIAQGESSSGSCQPVADLGHLCHRYNCLLVVDAVASLGAVPMYMDNWGVDVLYCGAQKVLGAPPGVSPISFSDKAWNKARNRKQKVNSFYFDIGLQANYWGCDGQARKYHHTASISSVYGLREGLAMLAEEGLEKCWSRHSKCSEILYRGLAELGLELLVKDKRNRLPTVTAIVVPPGIQWQRVRDYAMENRKVEIAGGLGPTDGKIWRIGIMGYNATEYNVRRVLAALGQALNHVKANKSKL